MPIRPEQSHKQLHEQPKDLNDLLEEAQTDVRWAIGKLEYLRGELEKNNLSRDKAACVIEAIDKLKEELHRGDLY